MASLGRNDPCHCGSGKKYKNCHLDADEAKERAERTQAESEAAAPAAEAEGEPQKAAPAAPRHQTRQPWKGGAQNTRGFQKVTASRKVGGGG
jgi:hypothetical protein